MSDCDIIIDTNQVLHFQPIDQIDWCALTGCNHCTLVITPILLRELEQKKIFSPSATLKSRAARMIDFLVSKMVLPDPIELRPKVTLAFVVQEPAIDFATHQLVREINDDHYIATAIERQNAGRVTLIASNDGGMAMKLRSRAIRVLRLTDALRLPDEVEAGAKELRDAKLEIARLKSRQPKLSAAFRGGASKREIRNARAIEMGVPSLSKIRADHPLLPLPGEPSASNVGALSAYRSISALGMPSRERIEQHNAALRSYYTLYERYLRELRQWTENLRLTATLHLILKNDGSATATNIDVTVNFPKTIFLSSVSERASEPVAPDAPAKPNTLSALNTYVGNGARAIYPDYRAPLFNLYDGAAHIDENNPHSAQFSIEALKQKCSLELDDFFLLRAPDLTGKGAEIDVEITFHEAEPVHHKLAITFAEVDASESDD
ncbi:hypothetical protein [Sphingomonas glacialis]|uniref:PIN domain-containing protein n=1 Tax=Sphingomonas glacialis TaxID=658225 RepID=A0A502G648_9SPHN|nr:hypothetical protein [Sphingomonas glacialis]TPG56353.1 hypothetical protein EAH76_01980 [Sphingomonas glacialis]